MENLIFSGIQNSAKVIDETIYNTFNSPNLKDSFYLNKQNVNTIDLIHFKESNFNLNKTSDKFTSEQLQMIIYNRIIVSSIGSFLCILCIFLYIIVYIKKRFRTNNINLNVKLKDIKNVKMIDNKLRETLIIESDNSNQKNLIISEEEIQYKTLDLYHTPNYLRPSATFFNENRTSKEIKTFYGSENKENKENFKNLFKSDEKISKVDTISSIDYQRKTGYSIAAEINFNKDSLNHIQSNEQEKLYRISEPIYNANNDLSIPSDDHIDKNAKTHIDESLYNYKLSYNETKEKVEEKNKHFYCNSKVKNQFNGMGNYNIIDNEKDILEIIYEKNLHNPEFHRSFKNLNNQKLENSESIENNRSSKSDIICVSKQKNNNCTFNYNFRISKKFGDDNSCIDHLKISSPKNISKIPFRNSNCTSEINSIFDYKLLNQNTSSNNFSKNNNCNNSIFLNSKKNETILSPSDKDEKNYNFTYDNISRVSNNSITRDVENNECKPRDLEMGMINDILMMLIISNLGFMSASFIVYDVEYLNKEYKICEIQGMIQNYFDLASICWTTVISNIIKNIIISKNPQNEKKKFKWYLFYSGFFPLLLSSL